MKKLLLALVIAALPALALPQSDMSRWVTYSAPVAAQAASATKTAVAGARHVVVNITVCVATAATAQTPLQVNINDGAATVWSARLAAPVNSSSCIIGPVYIVGSVNANLVIGTAAPVAGAFASVAMTGYTTH